MKMVTRIRSGLVGLAFVTVLLVGFVSIWGGVLAGGPLGLFMIWNGASCGLIAWRARKGVRRYERVDLGAAE